MPMTSKCWADASLLDIDAVHRVWLGWVWSSVRKGAEGDVDCWAGSWVLGGGGVRRRAAATVYIIYKGCKGRAY